MKKYLALAFLLVGLLLSITSCAPVFRFGIESVTSDAATRPEVSFVTVILFLAFALLLAVIGILLLARQRTLSGTAEYQPPPWIRKLLHAGPLLMYLGIPMAHLLIPLWVWLRTGVNDNWQKESVVALDFQITWSLYMVVAMLLSSILIGLPLILLLLAFHLWVTLRTVWKGPPESYPLSLDFVSKLQAR